MTHLRRCAVGARGSRSAVLTARSLSLLQVQKTWDPLHLEAADLTVFFPWSDATAPRTTRHSVLLEGGAAFGTGAHPTTVLCLEFLRAAAADGARVLDYGSGAGLLALAAVKYGAAVPVSAVEIDLSAIDTAEGNAAANDMADAVRFYVPPGGGAGDGQQAAGVARPELDDAAEFDVVVANILASHLVPLADELARRTRTGGRLGLSGVLASQAASVMGSFEAAGFVGLEVVGLASAAQSGVDEWVLVEGVRG